MRDNPTRINNWLNLILVLPPIILFLPVLIPGKALFWGITSLQFIPWHWAALQDIQQGILPLWNDMNGFGAPLAANYQSAIYYPPTWIVFIAGWLGGITWMAWAHGVLVVIHLIWAGWGMKTLVAKLGLSIFPQTICGLSFALCGYLTARGGFLTMIQAASWVPWILAAASSIAAPIRMNSPSTKRNLLKAGILLAITFSGQWLSGHAQISWYTLVFTCAWVFAGIWINKSGNQFGWMSICLVGAGILGLMISSIQLFPTIEYFNQSQRAGPIDLQSALSYSFWPWRFVTLFVPDFYGNPGRGDYWGYANFWEDAIYIGLLPLFLASLTIVGLFQRVPHHFIKSNKPFLWFAFTTNILVIILALGWFTPIFPWLFKHIPTFGLFNGPARWMVIFEVNMILLAGFGAERWINQSILSRKTINLSIAGILSGLAVATGTLFLFPHLTQTFSTSILAAGIIAMGYLLLSMAKLSIGSTTSWRFWIILWLCVDMLWAGYLLNSSIDATIYKNAPESPGDSESQNPSLHYWDTTLERDQRFGRFFNFEDIRPNEDTKNLISTFLPNINLLSNVKTVNNFDPMVPARYSAIISEISSANAPDKIQYLQTLGVDRMAIPAASDAKSIEWQEIESQDNIRLVSCADSVRDGNESLQWMRSAAKNGDFDGRIVIEGEGVNKLCDESKQIQQATLFIEKFGDHSIIKVENNPKDQWLFIAQSWYPGWKISIDGKQESILRADHAFMAVPISAGDHMIELSYQPISFKSGLVCTVLGILTVVILLSVLKQLKEN